MTTQLVVSEIGEIGCKFTYFFCNGEGFYAIFFVIQREIINFVAERWNIC